MTTFPGSPKLIKGGIVLLNPGTGAVLRIIALQYNADSLNRSFQIQSFTSGGDRSEALRLKGPPIETIKLEAEIDAADQLEFPDQHDEIVQNGLHAQLAALETLIYPSSSQLQANDNLANSGTLEIVPVEAPLTLFVWSRNRIVPVRLTEFSITEEAFDPSLNPIRAKVSLGMRVLSIDDLGFSHKGGTLFMRFLQNKEQLSARHRSGGFATLGINGIP
ncbi:hypothetical protein [Methylomicrobium sp. Wu6]|uniref:hypothetical protein n=1 Tax=Methylomicrobium sp. Wu6 TaxID=3107928 RepID=UPI002DD66D88|nr:hypothetical protein [Methylomicrobium sp. Wu6]MEC4748956.1 hypothetical protein [Methylomicrobium sp. Wu6]